MVRQRSENRPVCQNNALPSLHAQAADHFIARPLQNGIHIRGRVEGIVVAHAQHHAGPPRPEVHLEIAREHGRADPVVAQLPGAVAGGEEVVDEAHAGQRRRAAGRHAAAREHLPRRRHEWPQEAEVVVGERERRFVLLPQRLADAREVAPRAQVHAEWQRALQAPDRVLLRVEGRREPAPEVDGGELRVRCAFFAGCRLDFLPAGWRVSFDQGRTRSGALSTW